MTNRDRRSDLVKIRTGSAAILLPVTDAAKARDKPSSLQRKRRERKRTRVSLSAEARGLEAVSVNSIFNGERDRLRVWPRNKSTQKR